MSELLLKIFVVIRDALRVWSNRPGAGDVFRDL